MNKIQNQAPGRCKRCILPGSLPGIGFNEEGICNYCLNYTNPRNLGKDKLVELFNEVKKKGKFRFDCIVPLSGGRDSTYVLYLAKRVFGLQVLAVNFDNEFQTDQARANMDKACNILNVDFIAYRSKRNTCIKTVHYAIKASLNYGIKAIANCFCNACTYGYRAVCYIAAEKYNVPLILWGESDYEYTQHMTDEHLRLGLLNSLAKQFTLSCLLYRANLYIQRFEFPVRGNFLRSLALLPPKLKRKQTKEIAFFNYIPWNRKVIKEIITQELDWKKPKNSVSTWRIDCKLDQLVTYCFYNIFGCSKHCFGYHNMINNLQMTREEALRQELQTCSFPNAELLKLLEGDIKLQKEVIGSIIELSDKA